MTDHRIAAGNRPDAIVVSPEFSKFTILWKTDHPVGARCVQELIHWPLKITARKTVDNHGETAILDLHLLGQLLQTFYGCQSLPGRVCHKHKQIGFLYDPAGKVLQTGFVVQHRIGILRRYLGYHFFKNIIGIAVAPRPLRTPHGNQIEIVGFHQTFGDLHLEQLHLRDTGCHPRRGQLPGFFPCASQCLLNLHPKCRIQTIIRVRIDGQDR